MSGRPSHTHTHTHTHTHARPPARCGPCRAIAPVYEQLSVAHPEARFFKVDIDNPAVAATVAAHGISAVPTFTFFKGAKNVGGFSGAQLPLLKAMIAEHAK